MKPSAQRLFAAAGGLSGAAYLTLNSVWPGVPDFLLGLLLGAAAALMVTGLLPEEGWRRLRKWKRRGE